MRTFFSLLIFTFSCLLWSCETMAASETSGQYKSQLENRDVRMAVFHVTVPDILIEGKQLTNKQMVDLILTFVQDRYERGQKAIAENDKKLSDFCFGNISHIVIDAYWPGRVYRDNIGSIIGFRGYVAEGKETGLTVTEQTAPLNAGWQEQPKLIIRELFAMYKERKPYAEVEKYLTTRTFPVAASFENQPAISLNK